MIFRCIVAKTLIQLASGNFRLCKDAARRFEAISSHFLQNFGRSYLLLQNKLLDKHSLQNPLVFWHPFLLVSEDSRTTFFDSRRINMDFNTLLK